MNMFNQYDLSSNKEVLLWRMYSADAKVNSLVEGNYHSIYNETVKAVWDKVEVIHDPWLKLS